MSGKVGDAADCVALNLYIRAEHLSNQGFQSTQFDDKQFVVGYRYVAFSLKSQLRESRRMRTVDGKIAKGCACRALNLRVVAAEEEQDRVERVPAHGAHLLLGDLCKGQSSTALQVDIVRERERGQGVEGRAREEIGRRPVYSREPAYIGRKV